MPWVSPHSKPTPFQEMEPDGNPDVAVPATTAAALAGKCAAAIDRPVVVTRPRGWRTGPALKRWPRPCPGPAVGTTLTPWTLSGFSLVTNLVPACAVGVGAPGHPTELSPWNQARHVQRKGRRMETQTLEWPRELAKCSSAAGWRGPSPGRRGRYGGTPWAQAPPAEGSWGSAGKRVSERRVQG